MYLVLPIQRIPRYILLLQEMLKYTPKLHPDHSILEQALQKMKTIANYVRTNLNDKLTYFKINDTKREKDNANDIHSVQERLYGREVTLVRIIGSYIFKGKFVV